MKTLSKLKLDQISKTTLEKKELYNLVGGDCGGGHSSCGCGCCYEGEQEDENDGMYGGSDSFDNLSANLNDGIVSSCY